MTRRILIIGGTHWLSSPSLYAALLAEGEALKIGQVDDVRFHPHQFETEQLKPHAFAPKHGPRKHKDWMK